MDDQHPYWVIRDIRNFMYPFQNIRINFEKLIIFFSAHFSLSWFGYGMFSRKVTDFDSRSY